MRTTRGCRIASRYRSGASIWRPPARWLELDQDRPAERPAWKQRRRGQYRVTRWKNTASQFAALRRGEQMTSTFDAIVVGSGVNGLVAAAELAAAGWSVAL